MRSMITIALAMLLVVSATAVAIPAEDNSAKVVLPSFAPGAEVELVITVTAPKGWGINHDWPLGLEIAEENVIGEKLVEDAEFNVAKGLWEYVLEDHATEQVCSLPIKLADKLPDGEIIIPIELMGSICVDGGDVCALAMESIAIPLTVRATAPKDEKNQAQSAGALSHALLLQAPLDVAQ